MHSKKFIVTINSLVASFQDNLGKPVQ